MKAILFDLDNTLYAPEKDLFSLIDVRINRYMQEVVKIRTEEVDGLRRHYWQSYGATLQGLIRHHDTDPEDYLDYVHAVDVRQRLEQDRELQQALSRLEPPCFVFTNGSRDHAERVLLALGLTEQFEEIFDIRIAGYQPKPNPEPYREVLQQLGLKGEECVMVEDSAANLKTAKTFGMKTVLVGRQQSHSYIDAHLARPAEIPPLLDSWRSAAGNESREP